MNINLSNAEIVFLFLKGVSKKMNLELYATNFVCFWIADFLILFELGIQIFFFIIKKRLQSDTNSHRDKLFPFLLVMS